MHAKAKAMECFVLILFFPTMSFAFCFQCSSLTSTGDKCLDGESYKEQIPENHETSIQDILFKGSICSLVTSATGVVYHRGSLLLSKCSSLAYKEHMAKMIGKKRMHYGAVVSCCSQSGCNWNFTTATQNLSVDKFSGTASDQAADVVSAGK